MTKRRWPKGTWMQVTSPDLLKSMIKRRRYTYKQVAGFVGCHRSFISNLANGHEKTCTTEKADAIAACLGVDTELLFLARTSSDGAKTVRRERTVA